MFKRRHLRFMSVSGSYPHAIRPLCIHTPLLAPRACTRIRTHMHTPHSRDATDQDLAVRAAGQKVHKRAQHFWLLIC